MPFTFDLFGSFMDQMVIGSGPAYWDPTAGIGGAALSTGLGTQLSYMASRGTCSGAESSIYSNFFVIDQNGVSHYVPGLNTTSCATTPVVGMTTDGSGFTVRVIGDQLGSYLYGSPCSANWTVYDRSGRAKSNSFSAGITTQTVTDPDGLQLTAVVNPGCPTSPTTQSISYTDTLGQTVLTASIHPGNTAGSDTYSYTDSGGTAQTVKVAYSSYEVETYFQCSNNISDSPASAEYLPSSVQLQDGSELTFAYEATPSHSGNVTGRLSKLTLPGGGSVSYTYGGGNSGISCPTGVVPVMTRKVNDGAGHIATWTYTNTDNTANGFPNNFTVTVQDPAANNTVYYFAGEYQTEAVSYQGNATGTPLKTLTTCYNNNFSSCAVPSAEPTLPITQTDVYTDYNGGPSNLTETIFDQYGNTTQVKQYDFGVAAPPVGNPLVNTLTYYGQSWNGTSCTAYPAGTYLYNTPCYSVTNNAAGSPVAQTQITYSNTGHPATTKQWTGSAWLTSSATYNGAGTIATSTDANGALSTYYYNGTDGCSNSVLPTSVVVTGAGLPSAGLTTSTQWNCNGAVATQTSDPNGQPTGYTYSDPLWRITSMTDPLLNATNYRYPTPTTPNTLDTTMSFPSPSNKVLTTDGLGRLIESQTRTAPGGTTFDNTIVYGYSWNTTGAAATQTLPGGSAVMTTQYDAVGRPLSTT
ncbi:MAG: hypothetical protein WCC37_10715, partial [Candidatus Sulfotelmatobacter sp.]